MSRTPVDPTAAMASATAGLLQALGVSQTETRDSVEQDARRLLDERDHTAEIVGLRYGVLTLKATTTEAAMLRYDIDDILVQLRDVHGDDVKRIDLHTS